MAGWSILGILGVTLLGLVLTVTFGGVHGTEFCPQTFERRSYSYYELPLLGIQMTGERHEDLTGDTEKSITANKYITPGTGKKDWHVLVGSRGTRQRRPGDAGILLQYLDAEDSGSSHRWLRWSDDHKSLAKIFWPAVQRLALRELYIFVPELFDLAKSIDDPLQLQPAVDQLVARKLLLLARGIDPQKDLASAQGILNEALALDPQNADIQKARAALNKTREKTNPQ